MSQLAAPAFLLLIAVLFWDDWRKRDGVQPSWAPLAWMFLAGSRWASSWLSLGSPLSSVDSYSEGSPIDRAVFFALILWGLAVLARRRINWGTLLVDNWCIVLYFGYCLISAGWSDEPLVLVKRWVKDLGNPIMALVLLTEPKAYAAVGVTMRRLAFLLLPLSLLFVRYFPELGRTYHADGSPMYTGAGHQKNDLGLMCLVTGIYFFWKLLQPRDREPAAERLDLFDVLLMGMMGYLLYMSNSQTALACLVVSIAIMLAVRLPMLSRKPSLVVPAGILTATLLVVLESSFDLKNRVLEMLGRDPSFTNRTELWDVVLSQATSPLVGAGFMSFWTGARMQAIWDALGSGINQAHNGYLEQYINLGYVGVAFIFAMMLFALWRIWRDFDRHPAAALLRLCFLASATLYNYTEASFYGINNMWVMFLLATLDVSGQRPRRIARRAAPRTARPAPATNDDEAPAPRRIARRRIGPATATAR